MFRYVVWAQKDDGAPRKIGTYRTQTLAEEAVEELADGTDYEGCEFTLTDRETNDEWMHTSAGWRKVY
jgi:hypothetical protein